MGTPPEPVDNSGGINPAWNDLLGVIPEDLHSQVTPYLQNWDQSVQQKIETANKVSKEWEPYQPLREHGIEMGTIQESLQLYQMLNQNPLELYNLLKDSYKFDSQSGGNGDTDPDDGDPASNPAIGDREKQLLNTMAEWIIKQEDEKKHAAENAAMDRAFKEARTKFAEQAKQYGDFDENYVLAQMSKGAELDDAVQSYYSFAENLINNRPKPVAPSIMSSSSGGSGFPRQQQIDPTKLSTVDRKNLVAQYMQAASQQE